MSVYRPEFEAALRAFARVSERMRRTGHGMPVLVGGAAVELYSNSAIATGDFDVATPWQDEFEAALGQEDFVKPSGPGHSTRGWVHPDLQLGFEVVTATPFDGKADGDRIRLISTGTDGRIAVIAVEDIIADRLGQYASGTAREMLQQARTLFGLYPDADLDYMECRIREETLGDHGIEILNV